MCGIFGYIGKGRPIEDMIDGLARLEYRGYDSCGIASFDDGQVFLKKRSGKIAHLRHDLTSQLSRIRRLCILHTRWATHGKPTQNNSHPHTDCAQNFIIAHNGIIENYHVLKESLIAQGHHFTSETDTEVIAHLLEKMYTGSLPEAVYRTIAQLEGSFALAVIHRAHPDMLLVVRRGSPLIIGAGEGEYFVASDIPALLPFTRDVLYLADRQLAVITPAKFSVFTFDGKPVEFKIQRTTIKAEDAEKKGFEHFMLKEIHEQPEILKKTLSLYMPAGKLHFPDMQFTAGYLKSISKIFITACGTAYHAGYAAKYFLEKYCGVDVEIDTSSEFRYRPLNIKKDDLLITISQSGETADTLAAVREFKARGGVVLAVCNVLGSSLVKESDSLIYTLAGPEIGVASTKAYTAQVFTLFLFALYLAGMRHSLKPAQIKEMLSQLAGIPDAQQHVINNAREIERIAHKFSKLGSYLFLGRGIHFPTALEGALKLKEISYVPAEGYPAGEMKHGPIALIDEYRAVVCIATAGHLYEKMVSNMQEAKARKGKILGLVNEGDQEACLLADEIIHIPQTQEYFSPLVVVVALQLFAYHVAKNLNCEIDQPRNLAKSVTVE